MSVEAATTEASATADSIRLLTQGLEASLGKSLEPLKDVAKQMGSSKFGKNAKTFGQSMKGMAAASVKGWALEQVMKLIEPFMKLLELLEIPINALVALFTIMVSEIFIQLVPYMIEFAMWLMKLMPIFKKIGEFVGKVIFVNFSLMLQLFVKLGKVIWALVKLIAEKLTPAWEKFANFMKPFTTWLKNTFTPLWVVIKKAFSILVQAWKDSGGKIFGKDGFIAKALEGLKKISKEIMNAIFTIINSVIGILNKIPGVDIGKIAMLAEGGVVTSPTLAMLGERGTEAVVPLNRANQFGFGGDPRILEELEENNRLLRAQNKMFKETDRWRI